MESTKMKREHILHREGYAAFCMFPFVMILSTRPNILEGDNETA